MTPEQIEKDLVEAVDKVIALGWKIKTGVTCQTILKCCCVLGAHSALDPETYRPFVVEIGSARYGMRVDQISQLVSGFDECHAGDANDPFCQIGRRLREKYVK